MFNPNPRITTLRFTDQVVCHVIDDVLQDPETWVRYAAEHAAEFRPLEQKGYPGISAPPPPALSAGTERFFNQHLRRLFDARRTLRAGCRLSLVTTPEDQLMPYQMLCHHDAMTQSVRESIQACVLYLFKDATLGGTSFYVPARPTPDVMRVFADSMTLPTAVFLGKYRMSPGYLKGSNEFFTCVGVVPAQWNRLVFYDGSLLHSGHIEAPDKLNPDPRRGRLTLNGFFACRKHVA